MAVSFLFSHKVLYSCFFGGISSESTISTQAVERCLEFSHLHDTCGSLCTSQTHQKILRGLTPIKQNRFINAFEKDGTTMGVAGYDTDNIKTLVESSKALSEKGYVITIISEEEERQLADSPLNNRIGCFTPAKFLQLYEFIDSIHTDHPFFDGKELIDSILLIIFRRDDFLRLMSDPDEEAVETESTEAPIEEAAPEKDIEEATEEAA